MLREMVLCSGLLVTGPVATMMALLLAVPLVVALLLMPPLVVLLVAALPLLLVVVELVCPVQWAAVGLLPVLLVGVVLHVV